MKITAYEHHDNAIGIKLSFLLSDIAKCSDNSLAVMSYSAYEGRVRKNRKFRLREGRGPGNEVLINFYAMPQDWQDQCIERFGNPETASNPLEKFFKMDATAKAYYDTYQFADNAEYLTPVQIKRYTTNASTMNALIALKSARQMAIKSRGGSLSKLYSSLANDLYLFNDILKSKFNTKHTLGTSEKTVRSRIDSYLKYKYDSIIDGRNNNSNAQVVTPEMIKLWKEIFAGQRLYKPTHVEVHQSYTLFLAGSLDIVVNTEKNADSGMVAGEIYDRNQEYYKPASEATVYLYQSLWENKVATHAIRSSDRQKFKGLYEPFHKLGQGEFAGSLISIDDRQPPFKMADGKRMWFYMGADTNSEAFTCWVYGNSKEDIITEFYRQMVRNYTAWGLQLPYELECESSLNSSFKNDLLQPGAMFQEVRIEANNARGKVIEQYWRRVRYDKEFDRKEDAWVARPFALSEANQKDSEITPTLSRNEIIQKSLATIKRWNDKLHSNQELHPGMSRWDVFLDKQHPKLTPTNWAGILPHIGYVQKTSMKAGRIVLQGKHRVVGFNGEVALGQKLISIMKKIEGEQVLVYWLDDNKGDVLKSLVYDTQGNQICELLGDLEYHRAKLDRTEDDIKNRETMSAYAATVQGYIRSNANIIERVTLVEQKTVSTRPSRFTIDELETYVPSEDETKLLPPIENEKSSVLDGFGNEFNTSTKSRF